MTGKTPEPAVASLYCSGSIVLPSHVGARQDRWGGERHVKIGWQRPEGRSWGAWG